MKTIKNNKKTIYIFLSILILTMTIISGYLLFSKITTNNKNNNNISYNKNDIDKIIKDYNLEKIENKIKNNEELFIKYSNIVINNNNLGDFKEEVLNLFDIVSDKLEFIDEKYFFDKLKSLNIKTDNISAHGLYYPIENKIELLPINTTTDYMTYILPLYHELTHFLDYNLNDESSSDCYYICNNKYYHTIEDYEKLNEKEEINCISLLDVPERNIELITEGGAEAISKIYFNKGIVNTYTSYVNIFEILKIAIGEEEMDKIFFRNEHTVELYKILVIDNNIDLEIYNKLIYLLEGEIANEAFIELSDILIDIYELIHNNKWYEDARFTYFLYTFNHDFVEDNNLYNSKHTEDYLKYYHVYKTLNSEIIEKIDNGKDTLNYQHEATFHKDYNYFSFYVKNKNEEQYFQLNVTYNFNNNEIIDYELIEN